MLFFCEIWLNEIKSISLHRDRNPNVQPHHAAAVIYQTTFMMKKMSKILLPVVAVLCALPARADGEVTLQVVANDAEDTEIGRAPVTLESKLCFSDKEVEVYSGETLSAVFGYSGLTSLTFVYDTTTGIASEGALDMLRLRQNPVDDNLGFVGFAGEQASLTLSALNGETVVNIPEWGGEDIYVGSLPTGLYLVTVNNTTFKFIKK